MNTAEIVIPIITAALAVGLISVFAVALFTLYGRQDEADEIAAKAEGESDGN